MIEDGLYPRTRLTDSIAVNENHGGVLLSVFLFVLYNKFVFLSIVLCIIFLLRTIFPVVMQFFLKNFLKTLDIAPGAYGIIS